MGAARRRRTCRRSPGASPASGEAAARTHRARGTAKLALHETQARLQAIFRAAPVGIGVVVDRILVEVNDRFCQMLGYAADELLHQNARMLYPTQEECERVGREKYAQIRERGTGSIETRMRRKGGQVLDVLLSSTPLEPGDWSAGVVFTALDITERRHAEEALRESEQTHRTLFETMAQGVVYQAADGFIVSANPAAERILGLTLDQMRGRTSMDPRWRTIHEDGSDFPGDTHPAMVALRTGQSVRGVVMGVFNPREETHHWLLVSATPLFHPGESRPYQAYATFEDVTDLRRAEEALRFTRFALDRGAVPVYWMGPDARLIYVNDAACRSLGYSRDELLRMTVHDIDPDFPAEVWPKHWKEVRERGYFSIPSHHRTREGRAFPVEVTVNFVAFGGREYNCAFVVDVSERRRAEQALQESEAKFRSIVESSPVGMHLYRLEAEGRLVFTGANPAADAILGVDHSRFPGKTIEEAFPSLADTEIPDRYRRVCTSGEAFHTEHVEYSDDRIRGAFEVHAFRVGPGSLAVAFSKITERKRAEQAIRESEANLSAVMENTDDVIVFLDRDQRLVTFNTVFASVIKSGYGVAVAPGMYAHQFQPEPMRSWWEHRTRRALDGERLRDEFSHTFPGGEVRSFSVSFNPVIRDGEVIGVSQFTTDITERTRWEEDLRQLNQDLERRVEERTAELTALNQELEAFAYSVSHDLRAPLRAIDGFSRMLEEDVGERLGVEARRQIGIIRSSTRDMSRLIDDLLAFSRLGRQPVRKCAVPMGPLVQEVADRLRETAPGRQWQLTIGPLPEVAGDPALLREVLENLLSNAAKFTAPRSVALIEVTAATDTTEHVFTVRDNGVGFDEKYSDQLFRVFHRLHRAEEFEGTGVGLALVQRIVHRHGGRVWAEGKVDQGAVFHFSLPAVQGS